MQQLGRSLDIRVLRRLGAAAQQDDDHGTALRVIDAIAGAVVFPQRRRADNAHRGICRWRAD